MCQQLSLTALLNRALSTHLHTASRAARRNKQQSKNPSRITLATSIPASVQHRGLQEPRMQLNLLELPATTTQKHDLEKQAFHALGLEEPSFNLGMSCCGKQRVALCTLSFTAASITLAYSTLPARLRDKGSFLCSTLKTALRATLSAENQPCAANIARFVAIESESRKETDVALTACCSLHTSTDLKSYHQGQWISTVPAQTDLSCKEYGFLFEFSLAFPQCAPFKAWSRTLLPKQHNHFILIK